MCTMAAGRAALAAQWFSTLGFTMPYGVNVADYILDVASGACNIRKLLRFAVPGCRACCLVQGVLCVKVLTAREEPRQTQSDAVQAP